MKERQLSTSEDSSTGSPSPLVPMSQQQQQQQDSVTQEEILKQRNTRLQGRVHVLQEHNKRLEGCIAQLKLISEMVCTTYMYVFGDGIFRQGLWVYSYLSTVSVAT